MTPGCVWRRGKQGGLAQLHGSFVIRSLPGRTQALDRHVDDSGNEPCREVEQHRDAGDPQLLSAMPGRQQDRVGDELWLIHRFSRPG
jgi:hypothetical protein